MTDQTERVSEALKPCPFCGSDRVYLHNDVKAPNGEPYTRAGCAECGSSSVEAGDSNGAISAWNRRAVAAPDVVSDRESALAEAAEWALRTIDMMSLRITPTSYEARKIDVAIFKLRAALASPPAEAREEEDKI